MNGESIHSSLQALIHSCTLTMHIHAFSFLLPCILDELNHSRSSHQHLIWGFHRYFNTCSRQNIHFRCLSFFFNFGFRVVPSPCHHVMDGGVLSCKSAEVTMSSIECYHAWDVRSSINLMIVTVSFLKVICEIKNRTSNSFNNFSLFHNLFNNLFIK